MFKLCTNKNHSYKHNDQINSQNIDNSECLGVKFVNCVSEEKKVTKLRPFYYVVSLELVGNMPNFIFPVLFTSQCALESGRDIFTLLPRKCKLIIQMDDFLNINQYSM
jgi:hypothetical protein